jgi:glyoxylase-like metal-dependent hydrolase (beta-lactamase superfamily II)/rhodanese-related sulfurtransferase
VLFRQFVDDDLGCGSYLIGDPESGEAVLVDPPFAVEPLLEAAAAEGLKVVRVLETHTHADHVSGHGRLALEHRIPVSIHPLAEPEYPFDALEDGAVIEVGSVRIETIHTPGHRPEHCSFLVDGRIALTGDSLFVGDAARPDLAVAAREGAQALYGSLRRLAELPDDVEVYPGHVAGSLCGGGMRPDRSSTIGRERTDNQALAYEELQDFVLASASVSAPRPPTTERVVGLNRGPWLPLPTEPAEIAALNGATVLDVRPLADHLAGHVPGAISVPLDGGSFGTKAGFVLDADEPVVLHVARAGDAPVAARRLWAVGILAVDGYVVDAATPATLATVEVAELKGLLGPDGDAVQLLDVREASERDTGYVPGSRSIPYRLLRNAGADALDATRPVVTICESGARAAIAASLLQRAGYDVRAVVAGGIRDLDGAMVSGRPSGV